MEDNSIRWLTAWAQAHADMTFLAGGVKDNTARLTITNRIPGNALRIHFSNQVGKKAAQILHASVIVGDGEAMLLKFQGNESIQLQSGAAVYTDPISVEVKDGDSISVSVAVAGKANSGNNMNEQVRYSPKGDHTMHKQMPELGTMEKEIAKAAVYHHGPFMPLLSRIEIYSEVEKQIILCFGDSITQKCQWTKPLGQHCADTKPNVVIVNMGIDGNKLLTDPLMKFFSMYGEAGIKRFERDILAVPGATAVIFALGTNDIGMARNKAALAENDAQAIMNGLVRLNQKAHEAGMKTYVATLTPRGGSSGYKKIHEDERLRLNNMIRDSQNFDGILDFEAAVRDEADSFRFKMVYDSGDHLHPSPEGGKAIEELVYKTVIESL